MRRKGMKKIDKLSIYEVPRWFPIFITAGEWNDLVYTVLSLKVEIHSMKKFLTPPNQEGEREK